jgi:hypothetical protein
MSSLSYKQLHRKGESSNGITKKERISVDYFIEGNSLLKTLTDVTGGHGDLMGSIVRGYPKQNAEAARRLLVIDAPDTESGRVLLYICPECGDVGCGAYTVRVEKHSDKYVWKDFAYENGYEEARPLESIGPFSFDGENYEQVIQSASSL